MINRKVIKGTSSKLLQVKSGKEGRKKFNEKSVLFGVIGKKKLNNFANNVMQTIETAFAMYEFDGDCVAEFCHPRWEGAFGKKTENDFYWPAIKESMMLKKPINLSVEENLFCYAVPLLAKGEPIGGICFLYIQDNISKRITVINAAKKQLQISAQFFALNFEYYCAAELLNNEIKTLDNFNKSLKIFTKDFHVSVKRWLTQVVRMILVAFKDSYPVQVQIFYNDSLFQTEPIEKSKIFFEKEVCSSRYGKLKVQISAANQDLVSSNQTFLKEKIQLINEFIYLISEILSRKSLERDLYEYVERFKNVFENVSDGIIAADLKTSRFVFVNPLMSKITGYANNELISGMKLSDIHPPSSVSYINHGIKLNKLKKVYSNIPVLRKDGSVFFCDLRSSTIKIAGEKYLMMFFKDISHRLELENMLKIKSRQIMALSNINQALVSATSEKTLLKDVCRLLVNIGEYDSSWIGFIDSKSNEIKMSAQNSFPIRTLNIPLEKVGQRKIYDLKDLNKAAVHFKKTMAKNFNNFSKANDFNKKINYSSAIVLPLIHHNEVYGVLNIYSHHSDVFNEEEMRLLEEIANDLNFGILSFRTLGERENIHQAKENMYLKFKKSLEDSISIMSVATEKRDPYTAGHQKRVSQLAVAIAQELQLPNETIEGIYFGSLVHDIGKMCVPAEILSRPGRLSNIEMNVIKEHPSIGSDIVKQIDFIWPIQDMVLHHHERLDGSGYPDQLKGDEISLACRILAVADVVEAMNSHRPYRFALGLKAALNEIKKYRGTRYDPKIVDICIKLFKEKGFRFKG